MCKKNFLIIIILETISNIKEKLRVCINIYNIYVY